MDADTLVFNGIDASTGKYLFPPLSPEEISKAALGIASDPVHLKELRQWHHRVSESTFGPKEGVDPKNLWETGWGVIFAHDANPAIKDALCLNLARLSGSCAHSVATQRLRRHAQVPPMSDGFVRGRERS